MRSSVSPINLFTQALVDIAPWLPQCCTVRPIHAPARPAHRGPSTVCWSGQPLACCPGCMAISAGVHYNAQDTVLERACVQLHISAVGQHAAMQSVHLYPPRRKPVTALVS